MTTATRNVPVIQGEFRVTSDPQDILVTILGSCVATCLFDEQAGIGGLNHFLLARSSEPDQASLKYGAYSMELLINALLKGGAQKRRLKAKVFGGARMIKGLSDIGDSNGRFAISFLAHEGIPVVNTSLGGTQARKIRFDATRGKAQQMLVGESALAAYERAAPPPAPPGGDVELF
ncbi:chemotaxis protein CheD [Mesobaculum littorinae]|uniref:Probable chemoreceptor glutamine deamidase CheD n=1 Tax=Mesobaculum littorinae TaxID=2486419 RepID=A0A438AJ81_9RHOB|nr:chemotaxis protein CheD [Mesobaculum littorinae]RVV98738.1 chemotaxis protein CheD [Mesobaculum littorinae]